MMVVLLKTQREEKNVEHIKKVKRIYFSYFIESCPVSAHRALKSSIKFSQEKKSKSKVLSKDKTLLIANWTNLQENHTDRSISQATSTPLSLRDEGKHMKHNTAQSHICCYKVCCFPGHTSTSVCLCSKTTCKHPKIAHTNYNFILLSSLQKCKLFVMISLTEISLLKIFRRNLEV